jgi:hypothetical protein
MFCYRLIPAITVVSEIKVNSIELSKPSGALGPIEMDRLVSRREAAEYLNVSVATLARWQCLGTGPDWVRLSGNTGGYTRQALRDFVRARVMPPKVRHAA